MSSSASDVRQESLIRLIKDVFAVKPIPNQIVDLSSGDLETRRALEDELGGRNWNIIPADKLRLHHDAVFFLNPEGFHYLIPAFMTAALGGERRHFVIETVVKALTQPDEVDDRREFEARKTLFDDRQRAAIRSFLEFISEVEPRDWPGDEPARALRDWGASGRRS